MIHKNCGGEIRADESRPYIVPMEDDHRRTHVGRFPSYWCIWCGEEIIGDSQIIIPDHEEELCAQP